MKIRNGFVSNSSSSSFVVVDAGRGYIDTPQELKTYELAIDSSFGETQFGWGPDVIYDYGSRIIFAYLQGRIANNDGWIEMLENVIRNNSEVKEIVWNINLDWSKKDVAYIDHQSSAAEGENIDIFDSEERLKDFIFGKDSKIVLDNDNH